MVYPLPTNRNQLPSLRQAMGPLENFTSGVGQGWNTGQQMFDAGVAGLARAAGYQDTARDWERSADEQASEAQRYANPAVQTAPWREGGGGWGNAVPWAANLAGQFVGGAAPLVAGGLVGAAAAPLVPEAVGGAALASGLGMGLASYPQSVGYNYQAERDANAAQGGGEVTPEQAQSAAAWGVPGAALNAFAPTRAIGVGKSAAGIAGRTMLDAAKDVARTGIDNAIATGAQTAITQRFRPDVSEEDKRKERDDAIITGFLGGVGMGAAGEGVGRIIKRVTGNTPTQDIDAVTKQVLDPEKAQADAVQEQGPEGLYVREPAEVGGGVPEGNAQGGEVAGARPQVEGEVSFLDEGKGERPQEVAPQPVEPPDVPKQYLAEAEKAARDRSLDEKIDLLLKNPAPEANKRLSALQWVKSALGDETGALKVGDKDLSGLSRDELKSTKGVWWHGSPSGDMRGGSYGLHLGTYEAAKQALEARIGTPAEGEWDGTRKYGETLLAGKKRLAELDPNGYNETGFNVDAPEENYFASKMPNYGSGEAINPEHTPSIEPYSLNGKMTNSPQNPHEDSMANGYMRAALKRGNAKSGYYYKNVGEDAGSVSIVVPNSGHIEKIVNKQQSGPPEIVRKVGNAVARFVRNEDGMLRLPDDPKEKQPIDRPAGTPPIDGPLGPAPAVPPVPPKIVARPPSVDEAAAMRPATGGGDGGVKPPGGGGEPPAPIPDKDFEGHPIRTMDDVNGSYQRLVRAVKEGKVGQAFRQFGLWGFSEHHINEQYKALLPQYDALTQEREKRSALNQRIQANAWHMQAESKSAAKDTKAQEAYKAMLKVEQAHQLGIDPSVPLEKQSERIRKELALDTGRYKNLHSEAESALKIAKQNPKAMAALENLRAQFETNFSLPAAALIYKHLKNTLQPDVPPKEITPEWTAKEQTKAELLSRLVSPAHELLNNPEVDMSPQGAMKHAVGSLDHVVGIANELLKALPENIKEEIVKDENGKKIVQETKVSSDPLLQKFVENVEENRGRLKDAVYSNLMRQGSHGLSFSIAEENGMIKPEALKRVQEAVKADGFNVVIDPLSHQPDVFIRSDNTAQLANLKRTIIKLSEKGAVRKDNIKHGAMDVFNKDNSSSKLVDQMINVLNASDEFKAPEGSSQELIDSLERRKADNIAMLKNMAMHFIPEGSAAKSKLHRQYIAGFEGDPFRAVAKQSREVAQNVSNVLGTDAVNDRLGDVKKGWEAAKNVDHPMHAYEATLAALYNHAAGREEDRQLTAGGSWQDFIQSMVFSKGLGFNPSTAILQPLQLATYGMPELAKKVGFMKATTNLAAATDSANKVMRALWLEAKKEGGLSYTDMPITTEALKAAGLDKETEKFTISLVNMGGIDTGGINRSLGHIADARLDGSKLAKGIDAYTRMSSMMGYYAETHSRVLMGLAAKKTWEQRYGKPEFGTPEYTKMLEFAKRSIDEALFNYSNENRAQMTSNGPKGLFGNATKLAFVFQSYWMMAAEKMYREMHAIATDNPHLTKEQNAELRKEAWKFMLGHAAATAAVAGTLGLPGMTVFSSIYDKLHDAASPETGPYDMKQAFANWLEIHAGHSVGDAIAYGPSRLLGASVHSRTSEADFAPVPSFLTDRGPMTPAVKKWIATRLGAGTSIVEELARGYDKYDNGDYIGAVASLFPAGGRNVVLAGQQAASGSYRDNRGRVIPNAPVTAPAVATQLVGFTPVQLAQEKEADQALRRYDTTMDQKSGNIVNRMVKALRDNDKVAFNRMLPEARAFEKNHPGHEIVDRAKDAFKREFKQHDVAQKTGVPHTRWTKDKRRTQMIAPYIDSLKNQ